MSNPQRIPRPRHLFPELAGVLIEWKRSNLRATRMIRRAIGHVPIWVTGSLAGVTGIMLAISLFFVHEPRLRAASVIEPVTPEVQPTPTILPTIPPISQEVPVVPPGRPELTATIYPTRFPFAFDEELVATTTSTPILPATPTRFGNDSWRIAQTQQVRSDEFHSYLKRAAGLETSWPTLAASETVPMPQESPAARMMGIHVEKVGDMSGSPFSPLTYQLVVRNTSEFVIENIAVREQISSIARVTDVIPAAGVLGNELVWNIDQLAPDASRTFLITLLPEIEGVIDTLTVVSPTVRVSAVVNVHQAVLAEPAVPIIQPPVPVQQPEPTPVQPGAPDLRLTYTETKALKQGEILSMIFAVENVGTAAANDVILFVRLSGEFEHRYGEFVKHNIGTLAPGQKRRALLQATARDPGNAHLNASLTMLGSEWEKRLLTIPIQSGPLQSNPTQPGPAIPTGPRQQPVVQRPVFDHSTQLTVIAP